MKLEDFKRANGLVNQIDSIQDLIKDYKLGKVSAEPDFIENNDDFYSANFIKVFETVGFHSTGGGSCDLSRITIAKHKDMSGATYELSKQETIKLQKFLKAMLDNRLDVLKCELNNI